VKVKIQIARSQREYADVIVEAPSVEAAHDYVEVLLNGEDDEAHCNMVNRVSWNVGSETFDEEVLDAEEWTGAKDAEPDVTVAVECPSCAQPLTAGDRTIGACPKCGAKLPTEAWQS